jgi:hypothetical protein
VTGAMREKMAIRGKIRRRLPGIILATAQRTPKGNTQSEIGKPESRDIFLAKV